jgi:hypothetical protein
LVAFLRVAFLRVAFFFVAFFLRFFAMTEYSSDEPRNGGSVPRYRQYRCREPGMKHLVACRHRCRLVLGLRVTSSCNTRAHCRA